MEAKFEKGAETPHCQGSTCPPMADFPGHLTIRTRPSVHCVRVAWRGHATTRNAGKWQVCLLDEEAPRLTSRPGPAQARGGGLGTRIRGAGRKGHPDQGRPWSRMFTPPGGGRRHGGRLKCSGDVPQCGSPKTTLSLRMRSIFQPPKHDNRTPNF